ncbi:MAG: SpoIIE family protein phosphatase, partial [Oscillospiraceae bacterium]|nr:SpoIIE family protein phosphatase [Oscillospiraceae bacterium]
RRLRENRSIAYHQYAEFSSSLGGIGSDLGASLGYEPELEGKLRRFMHSRGVAADAAVFRDSGGRLHAEVIGAEAKTITNEERWLDKISTALGARMCARVNAMDSGHIDLLEAEPLAAVIGHSRVSSDGETISGDQQTFFKTEEGALYILLSDGMGRGEGAFKASSDTIRILERFLKANVAPETAVRMLNDIMLLKNEDELVSATVDLARLDLFTGEMTLYKYGAAPSFIKNGKNVKTVRGHSMSPGILLPPGNLPDKLRVCLRPGMFAAVLSDGVTGAVSEEILLRLISEYSGQSPSALSRMIVEQARKNGGHDDDITAIVIRLDIRK